MTDGDMARIERAKARLRQATEAVRWYAEGLGATETARRMGCSRATVWRLRVWLGLERNGRLDRVSSILEVSE